MQLTAETITMLRPKEALYTLSNSKNGRRLSLLNPFTPQRFLPPQLPVQYTLTILIDT